MARLAAIIALICSLGTLSEAAPDDLLSRADTLLDDYVGATTAQEKNALRPKISEVLRDLGNASGDDAAAVAAKFLEHENLELQAANTLCRLGSKKGMRDLANHLKTVDESHRRRCRRSAILSSCAHDSARLPNATLEALLRTERHREGLKAALDYLGERLSPRAANAILASLEGPELSPLIGQLERPRLYGMYSAALRRGLEEADGRIAQAKAIAKAAKEDPTSTTEGSVAVEKAEEALDRTLRFLNEVAGDAERIHAPRIIALRVLAARRYEPTREVVLQLAEEEIKDPQWIVSIAQAAAALEETGVGPFVLKHLKTMVRRLRSSAALEAEVLPLLETLVPLRVKKATPLVRKLSRSKNLYLRAAAIAALPVADEAVALSGIRSALKQKNWRLRWAAIEACRRLKTRAAVDLLIKQMKKEQGRLQYDLLLALHELSGAAMPYVPADWQKWWKYQRENYKPPEKKETAGEENSRTLVIRPSDPNRSYFGLEIISRRLALVLDISGSMSAELTFEGKSTARIDILKDQIRKLAKSFDRKTFFNVYVFESNYRKVFKHLVPMTPPHRAQLNKFVDGIRAQGATNLYDSLENALKDPHVDTVYVLSDGQPSAGKYTQTEEILEEIEQLNRLRRVQINTISIGNPSDLLKQLAERSSGAYKEVQ